MLLLLVLLREETPEPVVLGVADPVPPPAAVGSISREESPSLVEPDVESSSMLEGTIHDLDGRTVAEGTVRFRPEDSSRSSIIGEARVDNGRFSHPSTWLDSGLPSPERFLLLSQDHSTTSEIIHVRENGDHSLDLTVGHALAWRCRVTDFSGQPISGATVRVFTHIPYRGFQTTTDEDGRASGICYSSERRLGIQATAFGYAPKRSVFEVSANEEEIVIELPRLFAVAWYLHPAYVAFSVATAFAPADAFTRVGESRTYQQVWNELTAIHPEWTKDGRLSLSLFRESSWSEAGPSFELALVGNRRNVEVFDTVGRPILDGLPEPIIVGEEAYQDFPDFVPWDVVIEPHSAFLCNPPDRMVIPIVTEESATKRNAVAFGRGEGTFRTYLPKTSFSVVSPAEGNDAWSSDWMTGDAPRFAPGQSVPAAPQRPQPLRISLAPGESWVEIDVVDDSGTPCSASFWLAPSDGRVRHMVGTANRLPIRRFIRPGVWDLWYTPTIEGPDGPRAANKGAILVANIAWPPPLGPPNGRWEIRIPRPALSLDDFDTHYR